MRIYKEANSKEEFSNIVKELMALTNTYFLLGFQ